MAQERGEAVKRTFPFAAPLGTVSASLAGVGVEIPVFPGILKHPHPEELFWLLVRPTVLRKYTLEALRVAAWPLLRQFPPAWLLYHLPHASMRPERRRALLHLLGEITDARANAPTAPA
jgi:hypothetical protein